MEQKNTYILKHFHLQVIWSRNYIPLTSFIPVVNPEYFNEIKVQEALIFFKEKTISFIIFLPNP